jgi:hypothetical protein
VERSKDSGVRDLDERPDDVVGELSADIIRDVICLDKDRCCRVRSLRTAGP